MLGWSLICVFAIACLVIVAMLVSLPIVFLVGSVSNLMPPRLPKNIDTMPKETQEMYTKYMNKNAWSGITPVSLNVCGLLFALFFLL